MFRTPVPALALSAVLLATGFALPTSASLDLDPSAAFPTPFTKVPAPEAGTRGHHLTAFIKVDPRQETPLFVVIHPDTGEPVMWARGFLSSVVISDGRTSAGNVRNVTLPWSLTTAPQRFDVTLEGDTYVFAISQFARHEARTFVTAYEGRSGDPASVPLRLEHRRGTPIVDESRWSSSPLARSHTFTSPPASNGWSVYDPEGEHIRPRPLGYADRSNGAVEVIWSLGASIGYLHTSLAGMEGRYVAEGSGAKDTELPPGDEALVAGISGPANAPIINWAVVMGKVLPVVGNTTFVDEWSLFFVGPDGARTQVGDKWFTYEFHRVRVIVDEPAGRIDVVVDGAAEAFRFEGLALAPSTEMATGILKMVADRVAPTVFDARFDNLALYPIGDG